MNPVDFRDVPAWLADAYPDLFSIPKLRERLEVYAILHDLRHGIQHPEVLGQNSPPWSPWNRLRATLTGKSYLAELG